MAPFADGRCKTSIEEIQDSVHGTISEEQAVKLRQCLDHIDELEMNKIEREIFRRVSVVNTKEALTLIRTVPGFDKNPMTAIQMFSEIGDDMLSSTQLKISFHGQDVVLATIKVIKKSKPLGFPVLVLILK